MASLHPPDNWSITEGVWGTDADREETTVFAGGFSIKLINTTPTNDTKIESDLIPVDRLLLSSPVFNMGSWIQADRNNAGDDITIQLRAYDNDKVFISSVTIFLGPVTSINTWEFKGNRVIISPLARWINVTVSKANVAFNAYIDSVEANEGVPFRAMGRNSSLSIPDAVETDVVFNIGRLQTNASMFVDTATGEFTIAKQGTYLMHGSVNFLAGHAQMRAYLQIHVNGTAVARGPVAHAGNTDKFGVTASYVRNLDNGDIVKFRIFHTGSGGAKTIEGDERRSYAAVSRMTD